jgi:hypothetical protein
MTAICKTVPQNIPARKTRQLPIYTLSKRNPGLWRGTLDFSRFGKEIAALWLMVVMRGAPMPPLKEEKARLPTCSPQFPPQASPRRTGFVFGLGFGCKERSKRQGALNTGSGPCSVSGAMARKHSVTKAPENCR